MLVGLTLMLFVQKCQLGLAKNISSLKLKQNFHFALETRNGTRFVILRRCNFTRKKKEDSLLVGNWCPHCLEESHYHCVKNDFSRTREGEFLENATNYKDSIQEL